MARYNDITKKIFEAKRLTFPELHKPVSAKKMCVWQRSNKDIFPLEITLLRDDECQREATRFKQSVTVHVKSRKAEPFNLHWKRAMKLIFSYSLFQTQLFPNTTLFLVPNTTVSKHNFQQHISQRYWHAAKRMCFCNTALTTHLHAGNTRTEKGFEKNKSGLGW